MTKIPGTAKYKYWKEDEYGNSLLSFSSWIKIVDDELYLHSKFFENVRVQIIADWYNAKEPWHKIPKEAADKIRKDFWWLSKLEEAIRNGADYIKDRLGR